MQAPQYGIDNAKELQKQLQMNLYRQLIWVAYVCTHVEDEVLSVHEARKGIKRLRALLRLFRVGIGEATYRRFNVYFRNLARRLAPYRDLTVNLELMNSLVKLAQNYQEKKTLLKLRNHLLIYSEQHENQFPIAVVLNGIASEVLDIAPDVFGLVVDSVGTSTLTRGVGRMYRRGRKEYQKVVQSPTSENFHQLRKRIKYLKHHMHLLKAMGGTALGSIEKLADEAADLLGLEHDAAILQQLVELHASLFSPAQKNHWLGLIRAKRELYRTKARPLLACIYFDKPSVFLRRLQLALDCGMAV
jgi:CHAD domain-containing protein